MIQYSKIMFEESIKSKNSLASYTWYVQKFVDYFKLENFDSILKIPKDDLEKMVATYVIHTKKRVNPNSIPTFCKPLKLFMEVNDIELNWKKINRLFPEKIKPSGASAWQTQDVQKMLNSTNQLKNKAIIHFLAILGIFVTVFLIGTVSIRESFAENNSQYNLLEKIIDDPPLKQFYLGIPIFEIHCKVNLVLIQKYDGSPACVKQDTYFELIKRGWTSEIIKAVQSRDISIPKPEPVVSEDGTISENTNTYTFYDIEGMKQIYRIGEPISFVETIEGYGNPCISPYYEILDGNTLDSVWEHKIVYPCPFIKESQQFKRINTIPDEKTPSPVLNQTGTYILRSYHSYNDDYTEQTFTVVHDSVVLIPKGAVLAENESLDPEVITVVLGKNNTVTWINDDDTAHTFVSDKGGDESWSTGMMQPGESSSVTFNRTGVFEYYGTPGPWKTGKVIVLEN